MILAAIAAALIAYPSADPVSEYFPLNPGTKWTYEDTETHMITVNVAGAPVDVGGEPAIPVSVKEAGRRVETAHYRIIDDAVCIVAAHDAKKPYDKPIPSLRIAPQKLSWTYIGEMPFEGGQTPFKQVAESVRKGQRDVLGEKRDVVWVHTTVETPGVRMEQTAYYAKGIGMVEMEFKAKLGKEQSRKVLKLINFEPAKQGLD